MYCEIAASSPVTLRIAIRSHSVRSRYAAMSLTDESPPHTPPGRARRRAARVRTDASLRAQATLRRARTGLRLRIHDAKPVVGFDERRLGGWIAKCVLVPAEARQEQGTAVERHPIADRP